MSETKPYRDEHGLPMTHAELARRGRKYVSFSDEEWDPDLKCFGIMEHHGEKASKADGSATVHWDGDIWHHELTCSECGDVTTVDTDYKRNFTRGGIPGEAEAKEKAAW